MLGIGSRVVVAGRPGTVVHVFHGPVCELITVRFDDGGYGSYTRDKVEPATDGG